MRIDVLSYQSVFSELFSVTWLVSLQVIYSRRTMMRITVLRKLGRKVLLLSIKTRNVDLRNRSWRVTSCYGNGWCCCTSLCMIMRYVMLHQQYLFVTGFGQRWNRKAWILGCYFVFFVFNRKVNYHVGLNIMVLVCGVVPYYQWL